jgi:hypothetical protein
MILLTSLIVLLLILIIAQLYRYLYKDKEGFQQNDLYPIAPGENISNELESGTAQAAAGAGAGSQAGATGAGQSNQVQYASEYSSDGSGAPAWSGKPDIMSPSQKAQNKAIVQKTKEEDKTMEDYKRISNNSLDMNKLEGQVKELLNLGEQAKKINESFKDRL